MKQQGRNISGPKRDGRWRYYSHDTGFGRFLPPINAEGQSESSNPPKYGPFFYKGEVDSPRAGQWFIDLETSKILFRIFLKEEFNPNEARKSGALYNRRFREISLNDIKCVRWRYRSAELDCAAQRDRQGRGAAEDRMHELVLIAKEAEKEAEHNPTPQNLAAEDQAVQIALNYIAMVERVYPEIFRDLIGGGK